MRSIIDAEVGRAYAFARHADNPTGASGVFANITEIREAFQNSGRKGSIHLQQPGDIFVAPGTPKGAP